jgi:ribose 5-phosphate isomerase B
MRISIGSDHAGFGLKVCLKEYLSSLGLDVLDVGTNSPEPTDYPPFCIAAAEVVAAGDAEWGIVLGGSGQGEQIAANKVRGVRAALCNSPYFATLARRDNDANLLAIGARLVAHEHAIEIVDTWLQTEFVGGRHARRLGLIEEYENRS